MVIVVPDDEEVAATFLGIGAESEETRPRLAGDIVLAKSTAVRTVIVS